MIKKNLSLLIGVFCIMYCSPSSTNNWLDSRVETQGPVQNNSKSYMLFDTNGQGNMTKIYDSGTNQVKFIIPINDTRIQIIPGYTSQ